MIRTLIRLGLTLAGNAIGLWVAAFVLDKVEISGVAFLIAVVIFTVLEVILLPLVTKMAAKYAEALESGSSLVTTFLALLITSLVSDGLEISGIGTWVLATIIVWLATLIAGVILPKLFLRDAAETRSRK